MQGLPPLTRWGFALQPYATKKEGGSGAESPAVGTLVCPPPMAAPRPKRGSPMVTVLAAGRPGGGAAPRFNLLKGGHGETRSGGRGHSAGNLCPRAPRMARYVRPVGKGVLGFVRRAEYLDHKKKALGSHNWLQARCHQL